MLYARMTGTNLSHSTHTGGYIQGVLHANSHVTVCLYNAETAKRLGGFEIELRKSEFVINMKYL